MIPAASVVSIPSSNLATLRAMPQYRCYFINGRRYVSDLHIVTCDSDEAARARAEELLAENAYPAIEVWEGQRQVHEARKNLSNLRS